MLSEIHNHLRNDIFVVSSIVVIKKLTTNLNEVSEFKPYLSDKFVIHGDLYAFDKLFILFFYIVFFFLQQLTFITNN